MAEEFQAALFVYDEGLLGSDREAHIQVVRLPCRPWRAQDF